MMIKEKVTQPLWNYKYFLKHENEFGFTFGTVVILAGLQTRLTHMK